MIIGAGIGALEILLFMVLSYGAKRIVPSFRNINSAAYYWLCMTILTGLWETSYITNYREIQGMAVELRNKTQHVWTNHYDLSYVCPWKLAKIFYAEYGAWADREYMSLSDDWSHTIEGTHAIFCAGFSFFGMLARFDQKTVKSLIVIGMAMAFQLMNSILYMVEYGLQCDDVESVNFNNASWPLGVMMIKRPFMYVNVFWLIMPTYIIFFEIFNQRLVNINANPNNHNSDNPSNKTRTRKSRDRRYQLLEDIGEPPSYSEQLNTQTYSLNNIEMRRLDSPNDETNNTNNTNDTNDTNETNETNNENKKNANYLPN
jgi:hypothetical protein